MGSSKDQASICLSHYLWGISYTFYLQGVEQRWNNTSHKKAPIEIFPYLFLGDEFIAQDVKLLQEFNITSMINASSACDDICKITYDENIVQHYLPIQAIDDEQYPILDKHLEDAIKHVQECKSKYKTKCLIFSEGGRNRSVTLLMGIAMKLENITLFTIASQIAKQRGLILTNENFRRQLASLAFDLNLAEMKRDVFLDDYW
jgi:hypothetical protein